MARKLFAVFLVLAVVLTVFSIYGFAVDITSSLQSFGLGAVESNPHGFSNSITENGVEYVVIVLVSFSCLACMGWMESRNVPTGYLKYAFVLTFAFTFILAEGLLALFGYEHLNAGLGNQKVISFLKSQGR